MLVSRKYSGSRLGILTCLWAILIPLSGNTQHSVLQNGDWHKFTIENTGVYKIDFEGLRKTGIDPSKTDPRKIKIFGNDGGMLPQANSSPRPTGLTELAIHVMGEEDGVFNRQDYILFYGQGADRIRFDTGKNIFSYEKNLYTDKNFYFLVVDETNGKRIGHSENLEGTFPVVRHFDDYVVHEIDQHNELKSGREWFGEKLDLTTEHIIRWNIDGILANSTMKIVSDVMAQAYSTSSFKLFFNNALIGEQFVPPILNPAIYPYSAKGFTRRDTILVNTSAVSASGQSIQEVKYQYLKGSSGPSIGYLNFVLVNFQRKLALYNDQTIFRSADSVSEPISSFEVEGVNTNSTIWDVSDNNNPRLQQFQHVGVSARFSTETTDLKEFVVFSQAPSPEYMGKVANQNLRGMSTPNLLIVTHPSFKDEANRLAQHRQLHSGWTVAVATTDEVYNEFSSGRQDVTAIRDLARVLYNKNSGVLKCVLLFGRGSYDYKNRVNNNTNFVPIYESRNSLEPLLTYSSDDYFGFLEDHEGSWHEQSPENHTMDIGVGRLPIKSVQEARNVVDKIIQYETHTRNLGNWRKRIVFVADDGDGNLHQSQADQLATFIETSHPEYDTRKIYLDAYPQILAPNGEAAPEVNKNITKALDQGSLIINYSGHGNERLLAHERIFDDFMIETLTNENYPLFVTATCEFGRNDDPLQISSAELCVIRKNSGAIGMVTTTRPVNASTNFELNKAFYNSVFQLEDNKPLTLGETFRRTKNNSISGVSNRNFSLLGDPSLTLALPTLGINVTSVMGGNKADTLSALSRVIVKGEVVDQNNEKAPGFSGVLQGAVYDKETDFITFGNENPPFRFKEWHNVIFRGQATVTNGEFEFEFIVPKNIAYQLGSGKLSLYAFDKDNRIDAGGSELNIIIGQSDPNPGIDVISPEITLFMGDTTFRNGGITAPNTHLIARIYDTSGINISGYGIGNDIIAILDGQENFVLNEYYQSDVDDHTKGWIDFPMKDLVPGRHHLTVKAWDTFNNPGEATISFIVTDGHAIAIERFGNYPNPFAEKTTLFFTHNRSGDDLEAIVSIFDLAGKLLKTKQMTIISSTYEVNVLEFDPNSDSGEKLKGGLYLARLLVRSLTNGSKNEQVTKLIITN